MGMEGSPGGHPNKVRGKEKRNLTQQSLLDRPWVGARLSRVLIQCLALLLTCYAALVKTLAFFCAHFLPSKEMLACSTGVL